MWGGGGEGGGRNRTANPGGRRIRCVCVEGGGGV